MEPAVSLATWPYCMRRGVLYGFLVTGVRSSLTGPLLLLVIVSPLSLIFIDGRIWMLVYGWSYMMILAETMMIKLCRLVKMP